jgi:diphosphomevalonate decarboxylase
MSQGSASARACANIALAKYWGKADERQNLTIVPSLSLTLDGLVTTTRVTFDPALGADEAELDGKVLRDRPLARISNLLGRVRELAKVGTHARVESTNDFPTASGLASSASGFAALAAAASAALGLGLSLAEQSALARSASASAARSLFGGYVALPAGAQAAEPVASGDVLPVTMLVAVTAEGPKGTTSTDGMTHTQRTSPYFSAWVEHAPKLYAEIRRAVLAGDLQALGSAAEHSALMMHASMFAADPGLIYFTPATLRVIERVRAIRRQGTLAYFTIDAGPHVKVLARPADAVRVVELLAQTEGVIRVIRSQPGPGVQLLP